MGKSRIARIARHGIPYLANFRIGPLKMRPTPYQNLPLEITNRDPDDIMKKTNCVKPNFQEPEFRHYSTFNK